MTSSKLIVAMWPYRINYDLNPYTALLSDSMARYGVEVIEFGWDWRSFRSHVVHFHWPNNFFFTAPSLQLRMQAWKQLIWLAAFRVKGGHLVWTAHNIWPHDRLRRYSLRLWMFLLLIDGVIYLNRASKNIALVQHPLLKRKKSAVIPEMTHYKIFSTQSRQKHYTHERPIRLGNFGLIRPYKQLDRLIDCMKEIPSTDATLAISGASFGYPQLEQQLKELAQNSSNIKLSFGYLTHEKLERFVDECDAVILPYRDILNSGAAIFALSRLRPIMVPNLGGMAELRQAVGDDWVFCYSGTLTSERIREYLSWLKVTPRPSPPDMSLFDPEVVAAATAQFYNLK